MPENLLTELLRRIMPQDDPLPPNVQEGMRILAREESDFDPANVRPKSRSPLIGAFQVPRGAQAAVTPFGTIRVDPAQMTDQAPEDIADTLLHELTHVRQKGNKGALRELFDRFMSNKTGLLTNLPYGQRPVELEGYQAEADRRTRMKRRPLLGTPHFLSDAIETRGDIDLYPERPTRPSPARR